MGPSKKVLLFEGKVKHNNKKILAVKKEKDVLELLFSMPHDFRELAPRMGKRLLEPIEGLLRSNWWI